MKAKILFPVESAGDLARLTQVARLVAEAGSPDLKLAVGQTESLAALVAEATQGNEPDFVHTFNDNADVAARLLRSQRLEADVWLIPAGNGLVPQSAASLGALVRLLRAFDALPGSGHLKGLSTPYSANFEDEPSDQQRKSILEALGETNALVAVRSSAVTEAGELEVDVDSVVHVPLDTLAFNRFATVSNFQAEVSGQ